MNKQAPISKEDLQTYLRFVTTGEVKDDKHAKELRRLSKRSTTLSDVTVVARVLSQQQGNMLTQVMDAIQVQNRVLTAMGATDEMFTQAQEDYNQTLAEMQETLKAQQAAMEAEQKESK